jgi:hypothetical protein
MLARSHTVSEDRLTQTITHRQRVPSGSGEIMTAGDVGACIVRLPRPPIQPHRSMKETNALAKADDYISESRV